MVESVPRPANQWKDQRSHQHRLEILSDSDLLEFKSFKLCPAQKIFPVVGVFYCFGKHNMKAGFNLERCCLPWSIAQRFPVFCKIKSHSWTGSSKIGFDRPDSGKQFPILPFNLVNSKASFFPALSLIHKQFIKYLYHWTMDAPLTGWRDARFSYPMNCWRKEYPELQIEQGNNWGNW